MEGHRQDDFEISNRKLRFAKFQRLHMKNGNFVGIDFTHSRFHDCYFRHVTFTRCDFTGARFNGCNFPHAKFVECKLPYSTWTRTQVDVAELLANLPHEWPNVSRDLCNNLRTNAIEVGNGYDARRLLFEAMSFHREQLKQQVLQKRSWYQKRYGLVDRILGVLRLAASWIERYVWGYGETPWLVITWGVAAILGFGVYYWSAVLPDRSSFADAVELSALAFIGAADNSGVASSSSVIVIEGTLGLLFLGLLAAVVYRWISVRQI